LLSDVPVFSPNAHAVAQYQNQYFAAFATDISLHLSKHYEMSKKRGFRSGSRNQGYL